MVPFGRTPFLCDPDAPLLRIGRRTYFRLRQAWEGLHCFGMVGGGKSSALKTLAGAYLRAGMGGIVLCAKPGEVQTWIELARKNGRQNSVIVFDESRGFNFLLYELSKQGVRGLGSVIECLMQVLEAAQRASPGAAAKESDSFWLDSIRAFLHHAIPLIYSAYGQVTVKSIVDFITNAATDGARYTDPEFIEKNFTAQTIGLALKNPRIPLPEAERETFARYWVLEYPAIPDRTRGNIVISLTAKLGRFLHGRMRDCFCSKTDIVPEMTFHGAVIVCAMPALTWNEDGIIGQILFKYLWQRAVLMRNSLEPRQRERSVFLWADESQVFVSEADHSFLATCRESKASVVYISQTLPGYVASLGPGKQDAAEALIGKFGTQVFCANSCAKTNKYASELIGRRIFHRATEGRSKGWNTSQGMNTGANTGTSSNESSGGSFGAQYQSSYNTGSNSSTGSAWGDNIGRGENTGWNSGSSEQMDFILEPRFFAEKLLTGGPVNKCRVTCVWFKAGAQFADGEGGNFLIPTFRQR